MIEYVADPTQKWAVLCPGPSLSKTWKGGDYAGIIAINRACIGFECTHICMLDTYTWDWISHDGGPKGNPEFFITHHACWEYLNNKYSLDKYSLIETNQFLKEFEEQERRWYNNSIGKAMAYVQIANAWRVDIYGQDMDGFQDWDGNYRGSGRNDGRWKTEKQYVRQMFMFMRKRGMEVNRVRPESSE